MRTFPVSAGLLEHKQRMGPAIWEFLFLVDGVTSDQPDGHGEFSGIVQYGNPLSADAVARALQESIDTAKVNLRKLSAEGYVTRQRVVGAGYRYTVVNSKKWLWKRTNGQRVENPSTDKPIDLGNKPAADQVENPPSNKESKTLLRQLKRIPSPRGEFDHPPSVDPRHSPVRHLIQEFYLKKFRVVCTWNGREGKALSDLLAANPRWTETQLGGMVRNRFDSEGVKSDRPACWISSLGSFAGGPLDRYGRVKAEGSGNGHGKLSLDQIYERECSILRARA